MLSPAERRILAKAAEAVVPQGKFFSSGGKRDVEKLEKWLEDNPALARIYRWLLQVLEWSAALRPPFRRFSELPRKRREEVMKRWRQGALWQRAGADILCETIKTAHFNDPDIYRRIGCVWDQSAKQAERARYWSQVTSLADLESQVIECEAVVVGTGAGGAVVAKELAERGVATLMLEEGKYWTRKDFTGRFMESTRKFYRDKGFTVALGNTVIPIPLGKMVGGSTAINTGTCWRTPEWILRRWEKDLGLFDFAPEKLAPYFDRVEAILRVEPAKLEVVGGIGDVIARGCEMLGYRHFPLRRNAPDCDGQGVCNFGCPTDARRSTNVSYVPLALQKGAQLVTEAKVEEILVEGGKAVGVVARHEDSGTRLTVRAKAVVLACGSLLTPALLLRQNLANSSGEVGKNLTIHPAVSVCALFDDDEIASHRHAPQGYCVDTFHREGILLLGAGFGLDAGAAALTLIGEKFSAVMSRFNQLASFGVMVEDRPMGRVFLQGEKWRIFYWLGQQEAEKLKRGVQIIGRIYLAAGATEVYPLLREVDVIRNERELERIGQMKLRPFSFRIAAFHPLGTCRMGIDKRTAVVNPNHETFDVKRLFITDGSVVPTSVAVNPQETIMALATRAAERIAERLS